MHCITAYIYHFLFTKNWTIVSIKKIITLQLGPTDNVDKSLRNIAMIRYQFVFLNIY